MYQITDNADLRRMTTFGLPARCGRLIEFSDPADLPDLDRAGLLDGSLIIGGGSNLLFTRERPELTVVHPTAAGISVQDIDGNRCRVLADAGAVLDHLCSFACSRGLWGLENLSGIPGQIGGAAVQNVGAYGAEFKDVVETVTCYSLKEHRFVTLPDTACAYGYRDSLFKHLPADEQLIVCSVSIILSKKISPNFSYTALRQQFDGRNVTSPMEIREAVIAMRDTKLPDPEKTGSAGSFFKNPVVTPAELERVLSIWENNPASVSSPLPYHNVEESNAKLSAAWLIDKAGCKPMTTGGAALWQQQPLVIVNASGTATGHDVVNLEKLIISQVKQTFGITLQPEVIHI